MGCSSSHHAKEPMPMPAQFSAEKMSAIDKAINGESLFLMSTDMQEDRDVVLAAVRRDWSQLEHAADALMAAVGRNVRAIKFAAPVKDVALAAVGATGDALQWLPESMQADRNVVLLAMRENADLVRYAADALKSDKEFILTMVEQHPEKLKYAKAGLNQDPDCLKAAGIWDTEPTERDGTHGCDKGIFSVKYSLAENCSEYATTVMLKCKEHEDLGKYHIYFPSAFCKKSCDPKFTDINHPCRGSTETCKMTDLAVRSGKPTNESCWRYSFRYHQEECKKGNGFMIQVEQCVGRKWLLGGGQMIETKMAEEIGLKVFRVKQGRTRNEARDFDDDDCDMLAEAIMIWAMHPPHQRDMALQEVKLRDDR